MTDTNQKPYVGGSASRELYEAFYRASLAATIKMGGRLKDMSCFVSNWEVIEQAKGRCFKI